MTEMVSFHAKGEIAEVVIDNPPVNATSAGVRSGLAEAFDRFAADPALQGANPALCRADLCRRC